MEPAAKTTEIDPRLNYTVALTDERKQQLAEAATNLWFGGLRAKQAGWSKVTSPAIQQLAKLSAGGDLDEEEAGRLRVGRGKFAGIFTQLASTAEEKGVTLTSQDLVNGAISSFKADPEEPSELLSLVSRYWQKPNALLSPRDFGSEASLKSCLNTLFEQTQVRKGQELEI